VESTKKIRKGGINQWKSMQKSKLAEIDEEIDEEIDDGS
jgi:hypothetical protein